MYIFFGVTTFWEVINSPKLLKSILDCFPSHSAFISSHHFCRIIHKSQMLDIMSVKPLVCILFIYFLTQTFSCCSMPTGHLQVNPRSRSLSPVPLQQPLHSWSCHCLRVPQWLLPWGWRSARWTLHQWVYHAGYHIQLKTITLIFLYRICNL